MHVKSILSAKGGNVFSIEPTATLETAVRTLAEHKIGALLVLGPDRRIIGILSERDIVRVLAEQGADVLTKPLAQVMTRKVFTCNPAETIGVIMERMTAGKFRRGRRGVYRRRGQVPASGNGARVRSSARLHPIGLTCWAPRARLLWASLVRPGPFECRQPQVRASGPSPYLQAACYCRNSSYPTRDQRVERGRDVG